MTKGRRRVRTTKVPRPRLLHPSPRAPLRSGGAVGLAALRSPFARARWPLMSGWARRFGAFRGWTHLPKGPVPGAGLELPPVPSGGVRAVRKSPGEQADGGVLNGLRDAPSGAIRKRL